MSPHSLSLGRGQSFHILALLVTVWRHASQLHVQAQDTALIQGGLSRHLRRCTFCTTRAVGDEWHCLFDCPHFGDLRSEHAQLFHEAHGAMRSLMWHKDQKSVCAMILAIVNEAET